MIDDREQALIEAKFRSFDALELYVMAHLRPDAIGDPGMLERVAELRAEHIANYAALDEYRRRLEDA